MPLKTMGKIRRSMFTRLLLIALAAGILVNVIVGSFFRHRFRYGEMAVITRNVAKYVDYIVTDIGTPPDLRAAERISRDMSISMSITGPGIAWRSGIGDVDFSSMHMTRKIGNDIIGWTKGKPYFRAKRGAYTYIFSTTHAAPRFNDDMLLLLMTGSLTLVLAGAYLAIRKILRPLKLLRKGVRETAAGNLDYRVPVDSDDELGELTRSFNEMNSRITEMIRSRERLLLDVSHEFRSPLTRMKVAIEFIENGKMKNSIGEDITLLERMIEELLETERMKTGAGELEREALDIAALVSDVIESFADRASDIRTDSIGETTVWADRARLWMVIRNLIENALKHSAAGEEPVTVSVSGSAETATVSVTDRGEGIPSTLLPRVFDPFFRADSSRSRKTGGYGLGLALCRRIVEAHGGAISIESMPGKGTAVRFTIPKGRP
jgi:signal transduction histidine kinase